MLNGNARKNFTACGDKEAEMLLEKVLLEMKEQFSGTELCVYLGGSYGRGDGGVRLDRENGILYNDLDFFVCARKKKGRAERLLRELAGKYEKELKVDVDFSRIMSVRDIKKNAGRLMMQELKRGYCLVAGEDLLEQYLPEIPAENLPYPEACRLLLNRGMGFLLAGEKMAENSTDSDFILRNLNKAILGACDAYLIAEHKYKWHSTDRLTEIRNSALSAGYKELYAAAVAFKRSPSRELPADLPALYGSVRDVLKECMDSVCGDDLPAKCKMEGEISLKNFIKYCIKSRTLPLRNWSFYAMPAVAVLADEIYKALGGSPSGAVSKSKLYQQWLIFN